MAVKKVSDPGPFDVTISGASFNAGVDERFGVKPTGERKRGFGVQKKYTLTKDELRKLADLLAELACDEADAGHDSVVDAIYTDLDRFPEAAGL